MFALGKYTESRYHLEQITTFYEPGKHHRSFVLLRGVDAGLSAYSYLASCLLCLGYPDQALKRSQEALDLAHKIGHSFSLADVLRYGGCEFNLISRDGVSLKRNAEELISLSQEKNFPAWLAAGNSCLGGALVMLGQLQEGISLIRRAIIDNSSMNVGVHILGSLQFLAEAYAGKNDLVQGMAVTNQALELIRNTGERHWEAELYRLRSAIQLMQGDERGAETSLQKALEVARQQNARWWELRAAIDLAHLWRKQGKAEQARQLVKEIYSWFTEGFDTPELREADALCSSEF